MYCARRHRLPRRLLSCSAQAAVQASAARATNQRIYWFGICPSAQRASPTRSRVIPPAIEPNRAGAVAARARRSRIFAVRWRDAPRFGVASQDESHLRRPARGGAGDPRPPCPGREHGGAIRARYTGGCPAARQRGFRRQASRCYAWCRMCCRRAKWHPAGFGGGDGGRGSDERRRGGIARAARRGDTPAARQESPCELDRCGGRGAARARRAVRAWKVGSVCGDNGRWPQLSGRKGLAGTNASK